MRDNFYISTTKLEFHMENNVGLGFRFEHIDDSI